MPSHSAASDAATATRPAAAADPVFRVAERVRWEDVDLAGVVRYSAYTRLFDVAEAELWRAVGTSTPDLIERVGIWLPRKVLQLEYHAPARLDDLIEIRLAVAAMGNSSLTFAGEMWSADGSTRHASLRVVLVCTDPELRKTALPAEVRDRLRPYQSRAAGDE